MGASGGGASGDGGGGSGEGAPPAARFFRAGRFFPDRPGGGRGRGTPGLVRSLSSPPAVGAGAAERNESSMMWSQLGQMDVPSATSAPHPGHFTRWSLAQAECASMPSHCSASAPWPIPALALALAIAAPSCASIPPGRRASPDLQEIERLEDLRSLGGGRLLELAGSPDPAVRARAMVALGRIQDPSAAPALAGGLSDADAAVRDRAAFGAGLLGLSWEPLPDETRDTLVAAAIASDAGHERDGERRAFLDALARLGGPAALDYLASVVRTAGAGDERLARAAIGLGLLVKRAGTLADAPLAALVQRWPESRLRPRQRYGLAYALAFSKAVSVRAQAVECVKEGSAPAGAVEEVDAATALCARALVEAGREEDVPLLRAALAHRDYRVAVEATRTLTRYVQRAAQDPGRAKAALEALADLGQKVELLARGEVARGAQPLLAFAKLELPDQVAALVASLRRQLQEAQRRLPAGEVLALDLARIDCRLAAAQDRRQAAVAEVLSCGDRLPPEAWRLSLSLGQIARPPASPPAVPFSSYLSHPSPAVRAAALQAVGAAKDRQAVAAVRALLEGEDPVVATYAAGAAVALGDTGAVPGIARLATLASTHPDVAEPVASALLDLKAPQAEAVFQGWLREPQAHVRQVAARSLRKMGAAVPAAAMPEVAAHDLTAGAPAGASLRFATAKGAFTLKLDTEENPRTSANLYRLARRGFFDGLTFHRVEPDFVVQGGDPRGDGDGGPGYTLRCEVSTRRYLRGTAGMALSGKDTGGSQFFFTTSEQPHLEGRYTAFGEVVDGLEVLDRLLEGEVMVKVTASP